MNQALKAFREAGASDVQQAFYRSRGLGCSRMLRGVDWQSYYRLFRTKYWFHPQGLSSPSNMNMPESYNNC